MIALTQHRCKIRSVFALTADTHCLVPDLPDLILTVLAVR